MCHPLKKKVERYKCTRMQMYKENSKLVAAYSWGENRDSLSTGTFMINVLNLDCGNGLNWKKKPLHCTIIAVIYTSVKL